MTNIQHINYTCLTYSADGKTVTGSTPFATAGEAIARAETWRAVGRKAVAVETCYNWEFHEFFHKELA